jgi:GR25 family glycosyltransferase involved in LPS biosynthesis
MKTFILNLPHRTERMQRSMRELRLFNPEIWSARSQRDGAVGLRDSMKELMKRCVEAEWHPVLICEDDVRLLKDTKQIADIIKITIELLPFGWHQLYLGANIEQPGTMKSVHPYYYRVAYAKALHACVYSREGLIECLKVCHVPFDEGIAALHKNGRAYITNPMLADQYPGYSDIRQKRVDYSFMGKRYEEGKI